MTTFGKELRGILQKYKIQQKTIAEATQITDRHLRAILTGSIPKVTTAQSIIHALGDLMPTVEERWDIAQRLSDLFVSAQENRDDPVTATAPRIAQEAANRIAKLMKDGYFLTMKQKDVDRVAEIIVNTIQERRADAKDSED